MDDESERLRRYHRPSLRGKVEQPESVRVGEGEVGELELGRLAPLEEEHALVVGLPGDVERRPHRPTRVSARGGGVISVRIGTVIITNKILGQR